MEKPEVKDGHVLRALAALGALRVYKGKLDERAIIHCSFAVETWAMAFATGDQARTGSEGEPRATREMHQHLFLLQAAKWLGLFREEEASAPGPEWIEQRTRELQRDDGPSLN